MRKTIKRKITKVLALGLNVALCLGAFSMPTKAAQTTSSNNNATAVDYYYAKITDKSVSLHADVITASDSERISYYECPRNKGLMLETYNGDFGDVSELIQFIDYKGNINIAYSDSKYIYIHSISFDINDLNVIPDEYCNVECIDYMIKMIDQGRATSKKEIYKLVDTLIHRKEVTKQQNLQTKILRDNNRQLRRIKRNTSSIAFINSIFK